MEIAVANRKESIIQKKDWGHRKASGECPWRRIEDKHIRPGRPCDDSFCPEQYCVRSVRRAGILPHRDTGSQREQERALREDLARLSSSVAVMDSIECNHKLWGGLTDTTFPTSPIPKRRSQLSIRLHLLWLNFLLIPTRIRYMLRHSFQGPYKKLIITDRGPGQQGNNELEMKSWM